MQPNTKEIFQAFQQFVSATLANYERQFCSTPSEHLKDNLFRLYWKPFFDELLTEANRLHQLHIERVKNPRDFGTELQKIAEQGLVDFKKLTQSFASRG